jgi:hypothetical protein
MRTHLRDFMLLLVGVLIGATLVSRWEGTATAQQNAPATPASLQADVAHLKDIRPPDSHPMVDVAMFAANLWFAGNAKNWPLANYYLGETRGRIAWETRLNPGPKGADGSPVDMANIFDGIDHGSLTKLKNAIAAKDSTEFAAQYRNMLEDCYSCHKTANRPYLRPQIPTSAAAAQPVVNLDPNATWPQ